MSVVRAPARGTSSPSAQPPDHSRRQRTAHRLVHGSASISSQARTCYWLGSRGRTPPVWWDHAQPVPHLPAVVEAVLAGRRLHIQYRRGEDGSVMRRTVDPSASSFRAVPGTSLRRHGSARWALTACPASNPRRRSPRLRRYPTTSTCRLLGAKQARVPRDGTERRGHRARRATRSDVGSDRANANLVCRMTSG